MRLIFLILFFVLASCGLKKDAAIDESSGEAEESKSFSVPSIKSGLRYFGMGFKNLRYVRRDYLGHLVSEGLTDSRGEFECQLGETTELYFGNSLIGTSSCRRDLYLGLMSSHGGANAAALLEYAGVDVDNPSTEDIVEMFFDLEALSLTSSSPSSSFSAEDIEAELLPVRAKTIADGYVLNMPTLASPAENIIDFTQGFHYDSFLLYYSIAPVATALEMNLIDNIYQWTADLYHGHKTCKDKASVKVKFTSENSTGGSSTITLFHLNLLETSSYSLGEMPSWIVQSQKSLITGSLYDLNFQPNAALDIVESSLYHKRHKWIQFDFSALNVQLLVKGILGIDQVDVRTGVSTQCTYKFSGLDNASKAAGIMIHPLESF